jgi:ABC-type antimicrobial peptide transport system permease subunit
VKRWLPDTLYFLLKDMRHDWARTALTIFGMAIVLFSFFILSAFSQSLSEYNQNAISTRNLIVIQTDMIDPGDAVLEESAIQAAELLPAELVSRVSPVIFRHLRISDQMIQLRAARVEDWKSVFHLELLEGRWPKGLGEVAVGEGAAEAFGWKSGTLLTIYGSQFRVTAVARLPGSVFASVWMPLETAQKLFGMKRGYQLMFVQAAPGADAEEVRSQIQEDPRLAGKYSVFFEDTYSRRNNQILKDIRSLMTIGSSLALLAVTFGTYNSTSLSIIERGREIGILRAVGFSHIALGIFLGLKATLQSWIAFLTGLASAIGYIIFQRAYAQLFIFGFYITFKITWQTILFGFFLTSILAIFGAWLSSQRLLLPDVNRLLRN